MHVLNAAPRKLQKSDVSDYIRQFDQRSKLLLGIFERGTRSHVGFVRLDLDYEAGEALVSAIIGEADHRNRGANTDIFIPLLAFLFDTLGLERVKASVLERNQVTLRYLLKLGWQKDATAEPPVRSQTDGTTLNRCSVSWTRDGFRGWLASPLGARIRQRIA